MGSSVRPFETEPLRVSSFDNIVPFRNPAFTGRVSFDPLGDLDKSSVLDVDVRAPNDGLVHGRPIKISALVGDLDDKTKETWQAILSSNSPPRLFRWHE